MVFRLQWRENTMRSQLLLCLGLCVSGASLASCVIGAPPGFSAGTSWTIPLVDPLADGRLVTPVMVDGKGPFLFAIDPDARFTTADRALAGITQISAKAGPRLTDENDVTHPTWYAPIPNIKIGTLEVSLMTIGLVDDNQYDDDGRRIWGVIGRDVIADSLVFTVDRDHGVARLTVNDKYVPPANAQVLSYKKLLARPGSENAPGILASTRYLVSTSVDGKQVDLHLDLGDNPSQLLARHWSDAKLQASDWTLSLIDETGAHHETTTNGFAAQVTVQSASGPITRTGIGFVPYADKRWIYGQIDGTLGLDFFRPYVVSADWHHEKFYLSPRESGPATTAERIGRWNAASTARCAAAGCASATASMASPPPAAELGMADDAPMAPPAGSPRAMLHVTRDPALLGQNLEVVFAATSATGDKLPHVYADLGANTNTLDAPIEPRYANATFEVADISPFPRACASHAPSCAHTAPPLAP